MKTSSFRLRCGVLVTVVAVFIAGCAGPSATGVRQPFVGADYEQVYVTGSHIPVLVPKSPTARRLPGISPLAIITPDEIRHRGNFPMH